MDVDRSGNISVRELQQALSRGGMTFNPRTCKHLIRNFDGSGRGILYYQDFEKLYASLEQWTALFMHADKDRSGKLSGAGLLWKALRAWLPLGHVHKEF